MLGDVADGWLRGRGEVMMCAQAFCGVVPEKVVIRSEPTRLMLRTKPRFVFKS